MSESSFNDDAIRQALIATPDLVAASFLARGRSVAAATALRVLANAKANLAARTRGEGNTAAALKVTADDANKQFVVEFGVILNRPANLPLWLEYGFMQRNGQHQPGTYFMHDAAKAEDAQYARDMEAAGRESAAEVVP